MRNKPQQLSSYAKKLLKEQDNEIQNLSQQINDLQADIYNKCIWLESWRTDAKYYKHDLDEFKSMNLFQLILWWWKK